MQAADPETDPAGIASVPTRVRWVVLAGMTGSVVVAYLTRAALAPAGSLIKGELHLSNTELGAVLADGLASAIAKVNPRLGQLQDCVALLKPESQKMIQQHYYHEEDVGQIAIRHGVSEKTIYRSLAKIRRILLDCIERKLKEEQ